VTPASSLTLKKVWIAATRDQASSTVDIDRWRHQRRAGTPEHVDDLLDGRSIVELWKKGHGDRMGAKTKTRRRSPVTT
jgi:hypothetical protein